MSWPSTDLERGNHDAPGHNTEQEKRAASLALARMAGDDADPHAALTEVLMMIGVVESPPPPDVRAWHGRPRRAEKRAS